MVKQTVRKTNKTRKQMKHHNKECCEATFHGLHSWYVRLFEELGWMILAKHRGMMDKTSTYKTSLARLKHAIEHKLKHMKDHDKLDDLEIMHQNVTILIENANKIV